MRIKEFTITDDFDITTIQAVSLVESPAIEVDFIALSKVKAFYHKLAEVVAGTERKMIFGPALIPNKMILREDELGFYDMYFNKESVDKIAKAYMIQSFNKFSVDHEKKTEDCAIIENWIVQDPNNDKANAMGFSVPEGTWMMGVKVSDELWERIKAKELKGFSIEGFFAEKFSVYAKEVKEDDFLNKKLKEIYETSPDDEVAEKKLTELYNNLKIK